MGGPIVTPEQMERHREFVSDFWLIRFDRLVSEVFYTRADRDYLALYRSAKACKMHFEVVATTKGGIEGIRFDPPIERMAAHESSMKPLMKVIRSNGIHGNYNATRDPERVYEF